MHPIRAAYDFLTRSDAAKLIAACDDALSTISILRELADAEGGSVNIFRPRAAIFAARLSLVAAKRHGLSAPKNLSHYARPTCRQRCAD
jgi:hypothetical protein